MDSVGQEFGQCTAGTAWFCLTTSGASNGRFEGLGLESPAGLFTPMSCLVLAVDWDLSWGCQLEPLCITSSCHLASSQWWLGFKGEHPKRESQRRLYQVLWPRLGNHTGTSTALNWLRKETQTSPPGGGTSTDITLKEEHMGMDMY